MHPLWHVAIPLVGGMASATSVKGSMAWYDTLQRPSWSPPRWLFGPAWTALYVAMGYASYRAAHAGAPPAAMALYAASLVLNWAWTPVFFGRRDPRAALTITTALFAAVVTTMLAFWQVDAAAGWLMLPYAAWTLFATALNESIVLQN